MEFHFVVEKMTVEQAQAMLELIEFYVDQLHLTMGGGFTPQADESEAADE